MRFGLINTLPAASKISEILITVYIDFNQASDHVDYDLLLLKLASFGIEKEDPTQRYSLQRWIQALEHKHAVIIAFLDFEKTFDTVPHERLLYKLERIKIRCNLLKGIENFLVGRRQVNFCCGREWGSSGFSTRANTLFNIRG
ncbi:unnamed protein product [Schistocephalus solidus]|uniref:Reverse transcriptase domain-containing protein n=1 Tax=Schistocephalus solidus TaxID=70667 RepID=A0A183TRN6_SCHSO|nr:unnamed protein product [Schistocephalus solidus]